MQKYRPHNKSHEKFLLEADDFIVYTVKMLKNEKVCPKSARWLGADEIVRICQLIHTYLHWSNAIKVTNAKEKEDRHAGQTHAYALMETLGHKFRFCARLYNIDADSLDKWLITKGKIQSWISSWMRSDEERYKNIG